MIGERWLIHKGNEYGDASSTVAVMASHMGGKWSRMESKSIRTSTVGDFVKAGGIKYNILFDNCHNASSRMMKLP